MGTGDKPLVTAYSNVSEKYFTYGNICLNLGGFTPRTHFLHKLKTKKNSRVASAFLAASVFFHIWPLAGYCSAAGCC